MFFKLIVIDTKTGIPFFLIVELGNFVNCKILLDRFSHAFEIYKYILTWLTVTLGFVELYS